MSWQDNLRKALRAVARATRDAARATRDAARATPTGTGVTQNIVASSDGRSVMQFTSAGRRVSLGPGYVVVENTYWLTGSSRVTVTTDGVWENGRRLPAGRPVPSYRPGAGIMIKLNRGRLWLNGHEIGDYVAPPGSGHTSIDQRPGGGNQSIVIKRT